MIEDRGFNDTILGHYEDTGCQYSTHCLNCKYKDCIADLPYKKREMILRGKEIREILEYYERGLDLITLSTMFNIKLCTIEHWISKRSKILVTLQKYV